MVWKASVVRKTVESSIILGFCILFVSSWSKTQEPRIDVNRDALSKKKAFYLSVNVFSTKVLIGDTIFTSPTWDGTAILRGHPSHAKVYSFAG